MIMIQINMIDQWIKIQIFQQKVGLKGFIISLNFYRKYNNNKFQERNSIEMGNLIKESKKIYTFHEIQSQKPELFIRIERICDIPAKIHGKIIIPLSQVEHHRQFIKKFHHHIIIQRKEMQFNHIVLKYLKGIPFVNAYQLKVSPQACFSLHFNQKYCPIPLIFQSLHPYYIKNYMNSFHFYGINILKYSNLEQYLKSQCSNPFLICTHHEMQKLASTLQLKDSQKQINKKISIFCFCNKDYQMPAKTKFLLQKQSIEVIKQTNILDVISAIKGKQLTSIKRMTLINQKLYYFVNQKDKKSQHLSKISHRIEKDIPNIKILRIFNQLELIQKIHKNYYTFVLINNNFKEIKRNLVLFKLIQREGLQDRVIIIKRNNQKFVKRLQSQIGKFKYVKTNIYEKKLIFYGTLQSFKFVLKNFPNLQFKKFIDCSKQQKDKLLKYLCIKSEVIISNIRLCNCNNQFKINFQCTIIYVRCKIPSQKLTEYSETKCCSKDNWLTDEEQIIETFNKQLQQSNLIKLNYNFPLKKLEIMSTLLNEIFEKLRSKNKLFDPENKIFIFSCQNYTMDQITNHIMAYFSSNKLGNFQNECVFLSIKYQLYEELIQLSKIQNGINPILAFIEHDESQNIYELAQNFMHFISLHFQLVEVINHYWQVFLYNNKRQHIFKSDNLFFLMFLSFNKASYIQYKDETLQNITLKVKQGHINFDSQAFLEYSNTYSNNLVYNSQFLVCQIFDQTNSPLPKDILIKVQGNQLTNFNLYLPIWKNQGKIIIPPLTKFQIQSSQQNKYTFKLSVNSRHKIFQKFYAMFLSESQSQSKLFQQERQLRKLDFFITSMSSCNYQTAGYMLKKILKEQKLANLDIINAYQILYHLKKNQIKIASSKLRPDKYHAILQKIIISFQNGELQNPAEQCFEVFHSNKKIEDQSNEYQHLQIQDNSHSNSQTFPPMIMTDPAMIRSIKAAKLDFKRISSNQYMQKQAKLNKIKSLNVDQKRRKNTPVSISDEINSQQSSQVKIMILPPGQNIQSDQFDDIFKDGTFGIQFEKRYTQKEQRTDPQSNSVFQSDISHIKNIKSQDEKSEEEISKFSIPSAKKCLSKKQSIFYEINKKDEQEQEEEQLLFEPQKKSFNFIQKYKENRSKKLLQTNILINLNEGQNKQNSLVQRQRKGKKKISFNFQNINLNDLQFKRTYSKPNQYYSKIFKRRENAARVSNLVLEDKNKTNQDAGRPNISKLFTFFKVQEAIKDNQSGFSYNSNLTPSKFMNKAIQQEIFSKTPCFCQFQGDMEESICEVISYTSSLQILQDAEKIHPEEMIESAHFNF